MKAVVNYEGGRHKDESLCCHSNFKSHSAYMKALTICSSVVLNNSILNRVKCHTVSDGREVSSCINGPFYNHISLSLYNVF